MSMLNMLEKEINDLNLFEGNLPEIVTAIADSIPSKTIPYRMKIALAISEIMLYTSQFRINIRHWNNSIIPINSIMFCVAKSGAAKDSSLKAARKCFEEGYAIISEVRNQDAVKKAITRAKEAGCDIPDRFAVYKDYFIPPNPLFVAVSTTEGFVQHLNDLSDDSLGAGYIYSGEVGAELANNANLTENIKLLAELYDEGSKEVKVLKARENQSKEVKNLPVSALFMGSQDNLLYEDAVKRKFKTEFTTKLARRSFFVFVNEDIENSQYSSISDMLTAERLAEDTAVEVREQVISYIKELTETLVESEGLLLSVANDVRDLFTLYKRYNEEVANTIDSHFPISKLTRAHLQWKALKLAGALALIQGEERIEIAHYRAAIEFVELINTDVTNFEKELVKEPYELFADYVRLYAIDNQYSVSLHNLRKLGFIPMKGQSDTHIRELVKLANSYDEQGNYTRKGDVVHFEELVKTKKIGVSFLHCSGTKAQRASKCNTGFQYQEDMEFPYLQEMLNGDYAYSPFKFLNGIRGRDNIEGGCKWVVLDIDNAEITDKEAHALLSDINHLIARTSDKNNPNKFRILLELDTEVNIPDPQWRNFLTAITKDLGIKADILPKSQIFFAYAGRDILEVLDGEPLEVKRYLNTLEEVEPFTTPNKKVCEGMLKDPLTTFDKAFNAKNGEGSRRMIWAARYAQELGADRAYCIDLVNQINAYWVAPMEPRRFENTILNQINRWAFS